MVQNLIIGLWVVTSFLVLFLIILAIVVGRPAPKITSEIPESVPSCDRPLDQLPDVSNYQPCYEINLVVRDYQRYYDQNNNWTLSSIPTYTAEQVCQEFCSQTQLPNECLNWNSEYRSCLIQLQPESCSGIILPTAKSGNQYFYPIGRGRISCY